MCSAKEQEHNEISRAGQRIAATFDSFRQYLEFAELFVPHVKQQALIEYLNGLGVRMVLAGQEPALSERAAAILMAPTACLCGNCERTGRCTCDQCRDAGCEWGSYFRDLLFVATTAALHHRDDFNPDDREEAYAEFEKRHPSRNYV